jgi:hypothetical protein
LAGVIGCSGHVGPAESLEAMEEAIAQGVNARRDGGRY